MSPAEASERCLDKKEPMSRRQCPECGGELVLARHSDKQGGGFEARPSNYWHCSICGGEFTAEQVRAKKRETGCDRANSLTNR